VNVEIVSEEIRGQGKVRANDINLGAKVLNKIQFESLSKFPSLLQRTEWFRMHEI
jgi:hypothetical protein